MNISASTWREKNVVDGHDDLHVLVKLISPAIIQDRSRKPLHAALVIDRSGSMSGEKLELTKDAASHFINLLTRKDYVCVVAYDTVCDLVCPHTQLSDKEAVVSAIKSISSGDSTNLSGGWLLGLGELSHELDSGHMYHALLLTDGLANEGVIDADQLVSIGEKYYQKGIKTTTLGFGNDFDEKLLGLIADRSGGRFYYAASPESISSAFHAEFNDLYRIIGQNCFVQFAAAPEIKISRLYGNFPGSTSDMAFNISMGDVLEDDVKQCLFTLRIPSSSKADGSFGKLTVSYAKTIDDMEPYRSTLDISVEEKSDSSFIVNEDEVKKEVWLAMAARIKLEAVELAECGNTKDAGDLIHEHLRYMQGIKLQSDSIEREAIKLGELISSFEGDDISSLKKSAHFSAYEMMRKRGSYEAEADARIFEAKIRVSQPEALAEFDQKIKAVLKKSGYDESSIAEASTVFNELANNAIEHGCRNNQYASIWVKCRIAPSHIKFTVKDPGAGFDYEEVMSKINAEKDSSEERGRGLMIVNAMSERLVFSQKGTRVEAVVMRKTMRVDTFIATGTEEECIFLGNIAVVRLQGDIDLHNAAKTKTLVESLLTSSYDRLIIDLSKVRYIDSSGIGALIAAQNKYKKAGGSLVLASISASVSKVLKIAHLSKFFDIFSNIDEAVKYLRE